MLSKVAERIYWTARYIERVESTVRMLGIYDNLLFDLPRKVHLSWYNLVEINGLENIFAERYSVKDERNVVKFMLGDETNPSSVVSSLQAIRENIRTTRDIVLKETWELTNELSLFVQENLKLGINRRLRHEFLDEVIQGCQQIQGLLYGNMPTDAPWHFMQLGSHLERADMTTRNLDAGIAAMLETGEDDFAINAKQIILGTVLRSLNADQAYRRLTRRSVHSKDVVQFLIESPVLPRSIYHCLKTLESSCQELPRSEELVAEIREVQTLMFSKVCYGQLDAQFRDYLNELQIAINRIDFHISNIWFPQVAN